MTARDPGSIPSRGNQLFGCAPKRCFDVLSDAIEITITITIFKKITDPNVFQYYFVLCVVQLRVSIYFNFLIILPGLLNTRVILTNLRAFLRHCIQKTSSKATSKQTMISRVPKTNTHYLPLSEKERVSHLNGYYLYITFQEPHNTAYCAIRTKSLFKKNLIEK